MSKLSVTFRWLVFSVLLGVLCGAATALFLKGLDEITSFRMEHPGIVLGLPFCGALVARFYQKFGKNSDRGNDLVIDEIHDPRSRLPLRMTPFILIATWLSHLFGASVGREGTAVQMSGPIANRVGHFLGFHRGEARSIVLMSGMAAGFAAVFGTPVAGALFGLEAPAVGARLRPGALLPVALSAVLAHSFVQLLGVEHLREGLVAVPTPGPGLVVRLLLFGIVCGLLARVFVGLSHFLIDFFKGTFASPASRAFWGSVVFLLIFAWPSMRVYQGLGADRLHEAFVGHLPWYDWLGKLFATSLSLGAGLKGGEVTPLFFMGAAAGNAGSLVLGLSTPFLTAVGFVSVFAGAAHVPLSSTLVAMELFGAPMGWPALLSCVASFMSSGNKSIYTAQRGIEQK